jgi:hypothetical protein
MRYGGRKHSACFTSHSALQSASAVLKISTHAMYLYQFPIPIPFSLPPLEQQEKGELLFISENVGRGSRMVNPEVTLFLRVSFARFVL